MVCCSIVRAELEHGARKSQRVQQNMEKMERMLAPVECFPSDDLAAGCYGVLRTDLERGMPIGANDMLIAAIARARLRSCHPQYG